jgi:ankyrin repeat protein
MSNESLVNYAEQNDTKKIQELLESSANINQFEHRKSALHAACVSNAIDAAELLIKSRIDVNLRDELTGATALHYCAVYNLFEIANEILKNKGNLDIVDNYGNQSLWTAVFNVKGKDERLPLVELYLMYGANKNHKNKAGRSPLNFAEQVMYEPLLKLLNKY